MKACRPPYPLPLDPRFSNEGMYLDELLDFATSCELFQVLCGGVHILDFLTREETLYKSAIPLEWRNWFDLHDVSDQLNFLLHEDVTMLERITTPKVGGDDQKISCYSERLPPRDLVEYVLSIRRLALRRDFVSHGDGTELKGQSQVSNLAKHVSVGMKPKKIHEVLEFAHFIDDLTVFVSTSTPHRISHVIDFGSGQNYLGRVLASPPYEKNVLALESKQLNIEGARLMDVTAKLRNKKKVLRNKKEVRAQVPAADTVDFREVEGASAVPMRSTPITNESPSTRPSVDDTSRIHYIHTSIENGDLSDILHGSNEDRSFGQLPATHMVVSLHSCGNLLHHGLRSLIMNQSVKAVAMVGCCYNLVTERLGPATFKLPSLRTANSRVNETSAAFDPQGFPMSERLTKYKHRYGEGIRLNITARMMAVQAPENWTETESESFFTRHFYRALLQRIFLDRGLIPKPAGSHPRQMGEGHEDVDISGGTPIIIGSLRKSCYTSFQAYVRGAVQKLAQNPDSGARIAQGMDGITDDEIAQYEDKYRASRKELSTVWSLMAFSATVVEAIMVVDRWLYLKEQPEVKDCWVQTVFDYKQSPRNLVVVGIKH